VLLTILWDKFSKQIQQFSRIKHQTWTMQRKAQTAEEFLVEGIKNLEISQQLNPCVHQIKEG